MDLKYLLDAHILNNYNYLQAVNHFKLLFFEPSDSLLDCPEYISMANKCTLAFHNLTINVT